jgi:predicted DNA-binding protein
MMRPLKATYIRKTRKNKREVVSRSFRIPPQVDKLLAAEAKKKGWTKSFLIRDVLFAWYTYQKAAEKVEGIEAPKEIES